MTLKIRYKRPDSNASALITQRVVDPGDESQASADLRWSAAVASFGMALRNSPDKGGATLDLADKLAREALGTDPHGDRHELIRLIDLARNAAADTDE